MGAPQQKIVSFIRAARDSDLAAITEFLDTYGTDAIDEKCDGGVTALMWAAVHGRRDIAELLLNKGADIDKAGIFGNTPLMYAAMAGNTVMAEFLLEKGADINKQDTSGRTAVEVAQRHLKEGAAEFLEQWPELQKRRKEQELTEEIADFSPALKRPLRVSRPFKFK